MLYALINNDYQLQTLRRHGVAALGGTGGVTLITVPHALSPTIDATDFQSVHQFVTPMGRGPILMMLWRYRARAREVARELRPGPGDVLLFFTEVEWLNQIIAQHFRRCRARVVMLEDGGFATYLPMSVRVSEPLSVRERCLQAAYRLLPGLRRSRLFKVNGQLFPRLPDLAINEIALYRDVLLRRSVRTCQVRRPMRKTCEVRSSTVVFLNERMYDHYQTADAYLAGLRRLLAALTNGFESVHFKFHPREPEEWRVRICDLLAYEFPDINVINRPGTIEEILLDYRPEVLASYLSAALLNIEYDGIEPLYLYHLLDDVKGQPAFLIASHLLQAWGYRFVTSDEEVRSGYRSGIMANGMASGVELRQLLSPAAGHSGHGNLNVAH